MRLLAALAPRQPVHRHAVLAWAIAFYVLPVALMLVALAAKGRGLSSLHRIPLALSVFQLGPWAGELHRGRASGTSLAAALGIAVAIYLILARTPVGNVRWPFVAAATCVWLALGLYESMRASGI